MHLESFNDPLIHWLEDCCNSWQEKLNLHARMKILQALRVTKGIIEDGEDFEGDAFLLTVILHSWYKIYGEPIFQHFGGHLCMLICLPDDR